MDSLRKKIYFASDAHLGARFHKDPLAVEKRLVRWLDSIKDEAMAIYFLGDMFDWLFGADVPALASAILQEQQEFLPLAFLPRR